MPNRVNWSHAAPLLVFGAVSEGLGAWLVVQQCTWTGATMMMVSAALTGAGLLLGDALRSFALKVGGKNGLDLRISSHAPRAATTEVKVLPEPSEGDENDAG